MPLKFPTSVCIRVDMVDLISQLKLAKVVSFGLKLQLEINQF